MRWLYSNAAALVAVAHEDFGLTPVEAQSFGLPAVVLRTGGYLDSTIENVTGVFVDDTSPAQVAAGIRAVKARSWDCDVLRRCGERFSRDSFARRMNGIVDEVLGRSLQPVRPPSRLVTAGERSWWDESIVRPRMEAYDAHADDMTA
jgi:glycosyltransferase involved in cell wall biosynthesis